ncbi:MAG: hypothetical protein U0X39_05695 [Bacteroidales bacterium]
MPLVIRSIITILVIFLIISCNGKPKSSPDGLKGTSEFVSSEAQPVKDYGQLGFEIMSKESLCGLRIGMNMKEAGPMLGPKSSETEAEISQVDGSKHKTVRYDTNGTEFDVIVNTDGSETIYKITATAPSSFKTMKGIGIGSSIEEVRKAYEEYIKPGESDENFIVAGTVYGGLMFRFENGKVTSIFIGAAAE